MTSDVRVKAEKLARADRAALAGLAAAAVSRGQLQARGYLAVCLSSDLFAHGYAVRHWFRPSDGDEVLEYNPRADGLPRLTASTYEEQCAAHKALGLNLVPPGQPWEDYGQRGLFDGAA